MISQQEIIALAVDAGAIPASDGEYFPSELIMCEQMFETFAMAAYQRGVSDERERSADALVAEGVAEYERRLIDGAKLEREAAARICDELHSDWAFGDEWSGPKECAAAIRDRGQSCPPCNNNCNQGRDCPGAKL